MSYTLDRPVLVAKESGYAVSADGRVLVLPFASGGPSDTRTTIVLGWEAELERRLKERP